MISILTGLFLLSILLIIICIVNGRFEQIWYKMKHKNKAKLEAQIQGQLALISYPKYLENDEQIKLYILKNYRCFPNADEWGTLLVEMIRELTVAGWHTEILLYVKYKYGSYQTHIVEEDQEARMRFYSVIHKYEETHDTRS